MFNSGGRSVKSEYNNNRYIKGNILIKETD